MFSTPLRTMVSQNRRRYQKDGFNLDLTYITDRIIAMGYPADTTEALYRNSMSHIVKFLEKYHPGHYKVFNLRGQYVYDTSKFHNRVVSFEMTDHHPPRLELMAPFCREVHEYLDADPKNVVAVHCKAGKGRTGVMICAYLCYINFYASPRQNMDYYSIVRTRNNKGVTIPSQRRYVYYFAHLRNKKLNYMPQRMELVGIYVECPPKVSNSLAKGALKVRVANGDVDVFLGGDMWFSVDKYEEEEEMRKKYPVYKGDDHYEPYHPQPGKDCISRRCYGWTVPSNKRVFIEGDVRVDIFSKSQFRLLNVDKERKKIGHVWFNTMFCCSGFCGGQYVHGDEAYPYPDGQTEIITRRLIKKSPMPNGSPMRTDSVTEGSQTETETPPVSASVPCSPPAQKSPAGRNMSRGDSQDESSDNNAQHLSTSPTTRTPSFSSRKKHALRLNVNGIAKKLSGVVVESSTSPRCSGNDRSPCGHVMNSERGWSSQEGGLGKSVVNTSERSKSHAHLEYDCTEHEDYEEELIVPKPPGLDAHCPEHTLRELYPDDNQPPRYGIEQMLRDAYRNQLIRDVYNVRRQSVPKEGAVVPKSPVGRPNADGPLCVIRQPGEHVDIYDTLEIDRAHKNKEIGMGFKIFVVTKCVDESNENDVKISDHFLCVTHNKQMEKDKIKKHKVEARHKKLMAQKHSSSSNQSYSDKEMSSAESSNTDIALDADELPQPFGDDPRRNDPHLKKFFFRQRISSKSRHPSQHYHCPLLPKNPSVCAKYGCSSCSFKRRLFVRKPNNGSQAASVSPNGVPPIPAALEVAEGAEADVEEEGDDISEPTSANRDAFGDFDFFHPALPARTNSDAHSSDSSANNRTLVDRDESSDLDSSFMHTRSATVTAANVDTLSALHSLKTQRSSSERDVVGEQANDAIVSDVTTLCEKSTTEHVHPSDCSWASSSTCSTSSQSLSDASPNASHVASNRKSPAVAKTAAPSGKSPPSEKTAARRETPSTST